MINKDINELNETMRTYYDWNCFLDRKVMAIVIVSLIYYVILVNFMVSYLFEMYNEMMLLITLYLNDNNVLSGLERKRGMVM